MKNKIVELIEKAVNSCVEKKLLVAVAMPYIEVEVPANSEHGDYASNIAMILASQAKQNPRKIAQIIQENLADPENIIDRTQIAGPGFLNIFLKENIWRNTLQNIEEKKEKFGCSSMGKGKKVQVEFVSANPTGPLHIGHARGAVVGDVIANLLIAVGYAADKEYYINDAGNQMNNLGKSVLMRYRELLGEKMEFPESCYRGDYIKDIAADVIKKEGNVYQAADEGKTITYLTDIAGQSILKEIQGDLRDFGVTFDYYFSEKELYKNNGVANLLDSLRQRNFVYSDGETLWFKTTDFGDEKDRVVIRKNGEPTYFAADIAYHHRLREAGRPERRLLHGHLRDKHGDAPRGGRDGAPVAMSTRSGEFLTLREVLDEVGKDAARYNFLMRRSDSHLDFDLEIAKKQSNENPVFYVQYAHARICSIIRMAQQEHGIALQAFKDINASVLIEPEEMTLIKLMARYPEVIEGAVKSLEPHRVTFYLNELAGVFHSYYNKNKVISDNRELTIARLFLIKAISIVLGNALKILGVNAPEKM